jgi:hypothetical protein
MWPGMGSLRASKLRVETKGGGDVTVVNNLNVFCYPNYDQDSEMRGWDQFRRLEINGTLRIRHHWSTDIGEQQRCQQRFIHLHGMAAKLVGQINMTAVLLVLLFDDSKLVFL